MKKLLILVLALVMAMSLAVPALAFTGANYDEDAEDAPSLQIKLVDVSDGFFTVNFNDPPTNRGYLKNEVVCAVISLYVPKNYDFSAKGYTDLVFSGENVSLWQDSNFYAQPGPGAGNTGMLNYLSNNAYQAFTTAAPPILQPFAYGDMPTDNTITLSADGLETLESSADTTYHFAVFGKVVLEDAYMKVSLKGTGALVNATPQAPAATPPRPNLGSSDFNFVNVKKDFWVGMYNPNADGVVAGGNGSKVDPTAATNTTGTPTNVDDIANLSASINAGQIPLGASDILYYARLESARGAYADVSLFAIVVDKDYNCKGMYVFYKDVAGAGATDAWYQVKNVNSTNDAMYSRGMDCNLQFEKAAANTASITVETNAAIIANLVNICDTIVSDEFFLNISASGKMKDSWWAKDGGLEEKVAIAPWYAEIEIPPEMELEPPKTGDMVSVIGFVLIALTGIALVAMKKARA